uniref:TniQ family protein n=1 Tax=Streptomyces virginiae TaxID=1961 RepID=UPI0038D4C415
MTPSKGPLPCSTPLRRALPQQVRFIDAESAASYIDRLAAANGLEYTELLHLIGRGVKALPAPGSAELYLNARALDRLSVLSGHPADRLQRGLPAVRFGHVPPIGDRYAAWRWCPSESGRQHLVRACRACAAALGTKQEVFVWSDMPWQVCLRHGTWQDGRPGHHAWRPPADAMEWILKTHRGRLALEQRLGQMGRPLFADAYMTVLTWVQQGRMLPGWRVRQQSLEGIGNTGMPFMPSVVVYPEAVDLARLLGHYERQRRTGTLKEHEWWWQLAYTLVRWNAPSGWALRTGTGTDEARDPLDAWINQHNPLHKPGRKSYRISDKPGRWTQLYRHRRLRLTKPHEHMDRLLPLERVSCLPSHLIHFQTQPSSVPPRGLSQPGDGARSILEHPPTPSPEDGLPRSFPPRRSESDRVHPGGQLPRLAPMSGSAPVEPSSARRSPAPAPQDLPRHGAQRHDGSFVSTSTAQPPEAPVTAGQRSPSALNLRFLSPQQHAVIAAAARYEGVSMQNYILSAAYARATAVEQKFLEAFRASMSHSGAAFACSTDDADGG